MKRKILVLLVAGLVAASLSGCGDNKSVQEKEQGGSAADPNGYTWIADPDSGKVSNEPTSNKEDSTKASENNDDYEIGWYGKWVGGNIEVTISKDDVKVKDDMKGSIDSWSISGNTLTGEYNITQNMYPDGSGEMPEQHWDFTLVKNDSTISYRRETVLINADGSESDPIVKTATLTKVIVQEQ